MAEAKRVLLGTKTLILFGILLFLHGCFFFFQCNGAKYATLSGNGLKDYLEEFPVYVQDVVENAKQLTTHPLFLDRSSYGSRNLTKTEKDFTVLTDVTPVYGENSGIVILFRFSLTGYLLLFMGVFLVFSFYKERQTGLFLIVRCCPGGRFPLALVRVCSLALGLLITGLLLYLSLIPIVLTLYPQSLLFRPIQSVPEFCGVIGHMTVFGYLFVLLFRKFLSAAVICMLLYLGMALTRSLLMTLLPTGILLAEYLLYARILATSSLNALKYLNLYTMLFATEDYSHYNNVNLLGYPVSPGAYSDAFALVFLLILALLCLWQHTVRYPQTGRKKLPVFLESFLSALDRKKPLFPAFIWECKKILFSQKAALILAAFFYLCLSSSKELSYQDYRSSYMLKWYQTYAGEVDEEKVSEMEAKKERMEIRLKHLNQKLVEGDDPMGTLGQEIEELKNELYGLEIVLTQAKDNLAFTQETGIVTELIDPSAYTLLFSGDHQTTRKNWLFVLTAVILMFSGTMSLETSSNMKALLHCMPNGGRRMLFHKVIIVFFMSILCALSIHLIQFVQIGSTLSWQSFASTVQSIPCMRFVPVPVSIGAYLILFYLFRCLAAFLLALIVMLISHFCKNRTHTIAFSFFAMALPMSLILYFCI